MQPGQDWERVIIRPKKPAAKTSTPSSSNTVTSKKFAAGSNANKGGGSMAKLDAETEQLSHKKVGLALGKAIQQGRAAKGLTQAKLAQAINEKPVVINQYESGKAIPNGQIIAKIERALDTKLPRPKK